MRKLLLALAVSVLAGCASQPVAVVHHPTPLRVIQSTPLPVATPTPIPTSIPATAPSRPVVAAPLVASCFRFAISGVATSYDGGTNIHPLPGLWIDPRSGSNNTYVIGHNPGAGTSFLGLHAGQAICQGGHTFKVVTVTNVWATFQGAGSEWLTRGYGQPTLTFQTCITNPAPKGWMVRIVVAQLVA